MDNEIKQRIAKIYELATNGGTEGEKKAAKAALDRLVKKYNIPDDYLKTISHNIYTFKYKTELDLILIRQLFCCFTSVDIKSVFRRTYSPGNGFVKEVVCSLQYAEWVTVDCAYEYFRRHMHKQWKIHAIPLLDKCRTTKTRNRKREELMIPFLNRYFIASNLYKKEDLRERKLAGKDLEKTLYFSQVEGGQYNAQLSRGLMLENA